MCNEWSIFKSFNASVVSILRIYYILLIASDDELLTGRTWLEPA